MTDITYMAHWDFSKAFQLQVDFIKDVESTSLTQHWFTVRSWVLVSRHKGDKCSSSRIFFAGQQSRKTFFFHFVLGTVERFSWEFSKRILLATPCRIWQTKWLKFGQAIYMLKYEPYSGKCQATQLGATFCIICSHVSSKTFQNRIQDVNIS